MKIIKGKQGKPASIVNECQSFHTKKDRSLKHSSIAHERPSGQREFEERYKHIYLETKNV